MRKSSYKHVSYGQVYNKVHGTSSKTAVFYKKNDWCKVHCYYSNRHGKEYSKPGDALGWRKHRGLFSFTSFLFTLLLVLFCCSSTLRKNLNWIKLDYLEKKSRRWTNKVDVCFSKNSNEDTWIIIRRIRKLSVNLQFFKLPSQKLKWKPLFSPVEKISVTFEGRLGLYYIIFRFSWIFLKPK